MSYSIYFVDHGRGIVHVGKGVVSFDELLAAAHATNRDPEAVRKLEFAFIDFEEATELALTGEEVRDVVSENELTAGMLPLPGRVAIVAPHDETFGMARMWGVMVEKLGWRVQVVRQRAEAVEWLTAVVGNVALAPSSECIEVNAAATPGTRIS